MEDLVRRIKKIFGGSISTEEKVLQKYSHDASIFEIKPEIVAFPKTKHDISQLVQFVAKEKRENPGLSLTPRSAGTDMSGGAINESIIVSFEKTFKKISHLTTESVRVEPGVYYRTLEKLTRRHDLLMPAYPASKNICMVGGMVANNAGGEKSLTYGKVIDYVTQVKAILRDGQEYCFEPLTKNQLQHKMRQKDLEGEIYREVYKLVDSHYDAIKAAKPKVHKNSTGYNIWDVWDRETFDVTKLLVGSQGTLGIITQAEFKLVPVKPLSGLLILFLPTLDNLGHIIPQVLETNPTSFESFDDHTVSFAMRFFSYFRKALGLRGFLSLGLSLIPDLRFLIGGIPKLILLVEYEGNTQEEIMAKITELQAKLAPFNLPQKVAPSAQASKKYWTLRRESFNILRHNVHGGHTAPFIDDFVVPPPNLPEFFPKLKTILDHSGLVYTIAGHLGDGNFHIIPLMKLHEEEDRNKITPVMQEVNSLVINYKGSISGEHNDGLIRGAFLKQMYAPEILAHFKAVKTIFDPDNIFNPGKKMDADWSYAQKHIRRDS